MFRIGAGNDPIFVRPYGVTWDRADLVVTGRKTEATEAAAKELAEETGREVLPVACHMGDWDQIEALVERAYERFGKLDGLTVSYIGDGNNVTHSLLFGAAKLGCHIRVATPA